jgi:hypothetical protein
MSDLDSFVGLLASIQAEDDAVRATADRELQSMWKSDPIEFATRLLLTLQFSSSQPVPAWVVLLALTLARRQFHRSTQIRRMNEPSLAWELIPFDLAAAFASTLSSVLADPRPGVCDFAAMLLGQIGAYLVACGCASDLIPRIIEDIPLFPAPCAVCLHFLFEEVEVPRDFQLPLFHALTALLADESISPAAKPPLVALLGQVHAVYSAVLNTPEDCAAFGGSLLALTSLPDEAMKVAAYGVWQAIAFFEAALIGSCAGLVAQCQADVAARVAPVSCAIYELWVALSDGEYEAGDNTLGIVSDGIVSLLPLALEDAMADDEAVRDAAREAISSFAFSLPELVAPAILAFARDFCASASEGYRELALFLYYLLAKSMENETEWDALLGELIEVVGARLSDPSARIRRVGLKIVRWMADRHLNLCNCQNFITPVLAQFAPPLEEDAAETLAVLAGVCDISVAAQLLSDLIHWGEATALGCAAGIVRACGSPEITFPFYERALALAGVGDPALDLIDAIVRVLGSSGAPYFPTVFALMETALVEAASAGALLTMATIAGLSDDGAYLERVVPHVIAHLSPESDSLMQRTAVQSVVAFADRGAAPYFTELVGGLFLVMRENASVELQCRCMEAICALHCDRLQPYYTRLIPMAASALAAWESVAEEDPELAVELVTVALELNRRMLTALAPEQPQAGRCVEIALDGLSILPHLPVRLRTACLLEGLDIVRFLQGTHPDAIAAFLQQNSAVVEALTDAENPSGTALPSA